jgi:hypothetical protein
VLRGASQCRAPRDIQSGGRSHSVPKHLTSELEEAVKPGPWGGSTFAYRGAGIECLPGNHVCSMFLDGHPLSTCPFGAPGTITPLVDLWIEKRQLPSYMRLPGG